MFNVGDKVTIMECHAIPELVGKSATVVATGQAGKYPVVVQIEEAITVKIQPFPGLVGMAKLDKFPFREDELQPVGAQGPTGTTGIPEAFLKGMDNPQQAS